MTNANENMSNQQITISPNCTLTGGKLFVNGQVARLRTVDDLRSFVLSTQALVCTILEELFPIPVPDIDAAGNVLEYDVEVWRKYAADTLVFGQATSLSNVDSGRSIIQLCALASYMATLEDNAICHSAEFAVLEYITEHGASVLNVTKSNWDDYVVWAHKYDAYQKSEMTEDIVEDPGPSPLKSVQIIIPFFKRYVKAKSDEDFLSSFIIKFSSDMIAGVSGPFLKTRKLMIRLKNDFGLIDLFEASVGSKVGDQNLTLGLYKLIGDCQFFIRSERVCLEKSHFQYCFRFFPQFEK